MTKKSPLKIFIFIFFILLFLFCSKKEEPVQKNLNPKYETPQKLIETYWNALFEKRYKDALMCFVNFREEDFDVTKLIPMAEMDSLWVDSIIFLKVEKNRAEIHYLVSYFLKNEKEPCTIVTGDKLELTNEGWKISDVLIPW